MSYTKGPWEIGEWTDDQEVMIDAPNGDRDLAFSKWNGLAVVYGSDDFSGGHEKAKANARLIASAPDLLEALQGLLFDLNSHTSHPSVIKARQVIAKATGGTE